MGRKANSRNRGFWFWAIRGGWYHTCPTSGRRLLLVKGPNDKATRLVAEARLAKLRAEGGLVALAAPLVAPQVNTVDDLTTAFLLAKGNTISPKCHKVYTSVLGAFRATLGKMPVAELTGPQVEAWFAGKVKGRGGTWGHSQSACAKKTVKCLFGWACREGFIKVSPVRDMVTGQTQSRSATFTPEENQSRHRSCPATGQPCLCRLLYRSGKDRQPPL